MHTGGGAHACRGWGVYMHMWGCRWVHMHVFKGCRWVHMHCVGGVGMITCTWGGVGAAHACVCSLVQMPEDNIMYPSGF